MKTLSKGALYAAIVIVAVLLLALLGTNLYLRSPGVRQLIQASIQSRFGVAASYRSISFLPWRVVDFPRKGNRAVSQLPGFDLRPNHPKLSHLNRAINE